MYLISYLEVFAVVGVAAVLLGPKDLLPVARNAGWIAGRAGSFLTLARNRYASFAQEAEVAKLNAEVQQSMHQLHAIRAELQSGINIFDPGPMGRRLLKAQQQQATGPNQAANTATSGLSAATATGMGGPEAPSGASMLRAQAQARALSPKVQGGDGHQAWRQMAVEQQIWPGSRPPVLGSASGSAWHGPSQPSRASSENHAAQQPGEALPAASALTHLDGDMSQQLAAAKPGHVQPRALPRQQGMPPSSAHAGSETREGGLSPLPVSAVATGAAPDRSGTIPTGSDIAFDALMEEQVARQAQAYLSSPEGRSLTDEPHHEKAWAREICEARNHQQQAQQPTPFFAACPGFQQLTSLAQSFFS
ncbi:hypothetical protein WJX74_002491 [Apatococcus lobatus]|uniref:Uncharacterized protein n=2 Tax=Apatococcus TaxID=904362 RepID=A0AAW1RXU7_9CHLO